MNPAAAQFRRLLAFLPQIADGQEHAVADVAARLGVSAATIIRDLHALSERFGDPPGWIEKIAVYVESDRVSLETPTHFRRPMRLTVAEGRALELGLSLLRAEADPARRSAIDATRARLEALVPPGELSDDVAGRAASLGTERHLTHVPALREALRNRRRVAINYRKGGSDTAERRTICPFSFVTEKGTWYLVAHCDRSEGLRIFRLDRIESIELLAESFERPKDLDVDALLARGTAFVGDAPETLRVRYTARVASWIAEREPGTRGPDGSFDVEYPLADPEWAVRHVLQYGADAEVLEPEHVRTAVVARLRQALTVLDG